MIFHAPLDEVWNSRLKTRILRQLCQSRYGFSGRQLAGFVGHSHTQTLATLDELEAQGLVLRRQAGRAYLFTINEDHVVVTDILIPAFHLESALLNSLADVFYDGLGQRLTSVILFGSVARGEENTESDVDLLLVVKNGVNKEQLEMKAIDVAFDASRRFGNHISPIVVTKSEYDGKLKRKQGFWKDIPTDGRTLLPKKEREAIG